MKIRVFYWFCRACADRVDFDTFNEALWSAEDHNLRLHGNIRHPRGAIAQWGSKEI